MLLGLSKKTFSTPVLIFALLILYTITHFASTQKLWLFPSAQFNLLSAYISDSILFSQRLAVDGHHVLISPANAALIYPPGLYLITHPLDSVGQLFTLLFVVQVLSPILAYLVLRKVNVSRLLSFSFAAAVGTLFTYSEGVNPDWFIQPILLSILLLIAKTRSEAYSPSRMFSIGLLCGLTFTFKHNIGLFVTCAISTALIFESIGAPEPTSNRALIPGPLSGIATIIIALCGTMSLYRFPHLDEKIYYGTSFFAFTASLAFHVTTRQMSIDFKRAYRTLGLLVAGAALPIGTMLGYGSIIFGAKRYFASLFGMGFEYISIWDQGILQLLRNSIDKSTLFNPIQLIYHFHYLAIPTSFVLPFVLAIYVFIARNPFKRLEAIGPYALIAISLFMLFPLEGFHISATKVSWFVGVTAICLARPLHKNQGVSQMGHSRPAVALSLVLLAFSTRAAIDGLKKIADTRDGVALSQPALAERIGMKVESSLARDLERQYEVIKTTTEGSFDFYAIDSSGGHLASLLRLDQAPTHQYYVEMRNGLVKPEVSRAILEEMARTKYVIVYEKDLSEALNDPQHELHEIILTLVESYVRVGEFEKTRADQQIRPFVVFKKKE